MREITLRTTGRPTGNPNARMPGVAAPSTPSSDHAVAVRAVLDRQGHQRPAGPDPTAGRRDQPGRLTRHAPDRGRALRPASTEWLLCVSTGRAGPMRIWRPSQGEPSGRRPAAAGHGRQGQGWAAQNPPDDATTEPPGVQGDRTAARRQPRSSGRRRRPDRRCRRRCSYPAGTANPEAAGTGCHHQ